MGMSNAERQRKFRENRNKDLVKREAYLNKEKERYQKEKRTGKKKSVKDMTEREKRSARRKWRTAKHKERSAKKTLLKLMTPPNTPESSPNLQPGPSRQKVQSVKKRNRDQAKCYRDNKILEDKLAKQKRKIQMYKQRYLREKRKGANFDKPCPDTPRTKTKKLLRNFSQKEVRKTLIYHYAMEGQIKQSYQNLKDNSQKRSLAAILKGSLLRKYNLKTTAYRNCGIDVRNTLKVKTSLSRRM
ncbi:unnamed protein product [Mytilus coruscus]|uniref:Uncharacterized protein n=1 Tax=Mytilus coruscus TaxID=42192 RepID=A0A6J8EXJ1_MYTCO|nr:unnamed protein product [Mytilus coruscus]